MAKGRIQKFSGIQCMIFVYCNKKREIYARLFLNSYGHWDQTPWHLMQLNNLIILLITGKRRGKYDSCPISSWQWHWRGRISSERAQWKDLRGEILNLSGLENDIIDRLLFVRIIYLCLHISSFFRLQICLVLSNDNFFVHLFRQFY